MHSLQHNPVCQLQLHVTAPPRGRQSKLHIYSDYSTFPCNGHSYTLLPAPFHCVKYLGARAPRWDVPDNKAHSAVIFAGRDNVTHHIEKGAGLELFSRTNHGP